VNNSINGPGTSPNWEQTAGSVFDWTPKAGSGYVTVGYNATVGAGDISVYLISPEIPMSNGDTISFWTRTWGEPSFPDRMSVAISTSMAGEPESFTNNLLTINPVLTTSGYPTDWTEYTVIVNGLPEQRSTPARFAFWYNPTDGGPLGNNSDRIGLDEVNYTAAPTPGSAALLGLGGLLCTRRRR
jgi:hypothetical protein